MSPRARQRSPRCGPRAGGEQGPDRGCSFLCMCALTWGEMPGDGAALNCRPGRVPCPHWQVDVACGRGLPSRGRLCTSPEGGEREELARGHPAGWPGRLCVGTRAHQSLPPALPSSPPLPRVRTHTLPSALVQQSPKRPASLQGPPGTPDSCEAGPLPCPAPPLQRRRLQVDATLRFPCFCPHLSLG